VNADKLALYGISFGGYFATRGAAHDQRIKALIANSPIIDLRAYMSGFVAADESAGDEGNDQDIGLDDVDAVPDRDMPPEVKLSFKSSCRRFGVRRFSEWLDALGAYRVTENLDRITCPALALVGTGGGDEALRQHAAFCEAVSGPVTSRIFAVQEGADMHCQLGNLPLSNAILYDWLAETFGSL
jgi:pimeloyl-ACP methyl ester carboxylesterase